MTDSSAIPKSPASKVLIGMSYIGQAFGEAPKSAGQAVAAILSGQVDEALRHAFFFSQHGRYAQAEADLSCPEVSLTLDALKGRFRSFIQSGLDAISKEEGEKLRAQLRESNRPHAQGTVAELAAKLGISKSEVRRLKASGTLDQFIRQRECSALPAGVQPQTPLA